MLVDIDQIHPVQQKLRFVHYQVLARTLLTTTGDAKLIKRNHVTREACNKTWEDYIREPIGLLVHLIGFWKP